MLTVDLSPTTLEVEAARMLRETLGARGRVHRDLSICDNCEQAALDHDRLTSATGDPQIKETLRRATDTAFQHGVRGVPAIGIHDELFWSDDRLEDATAYLSARADILPTNETAGPRGLNGSPCAWKSPERRSPAVRSCRD